MAVSVYSLFYAFDCREVDEDAGRSTRPERPIASLIIFGSIK